MLEQRLASAEKRIHALLPPDEKFAIDEPAPEHEEQLRPFFDELFEVKPGAEAPYELECRGTTCRLSAPRMDDWMGPLQARGVTRFEGMMFGGEEAYLTVAEPQQDPNKKLVLQIVASVQGSPAIEACRKNNPHTASELFAVIKLDVLARRLTVEMTGDLANQPVGACARRVVEEAIAKIVVEPAVTELQALPFPVVVPSE